MAIKGRSQTVGGNGYIYRHSAGRVLAGVLTVRLLTMCCLIFCLAVVTGDRSTMAGALQVNANSGVQVEELERQSEWPEELSKVAERFLIAVAGSVGAIRRLEKATKADRVMLVAQLGHSGRVWSFGFSPKRTRILTGFIDNTARIWDAVIGKELRRFEGHSGYVYSVAFSPDGARILAGSYGDTARLWGLPEYPGLRLRLEGQCIDRRIEGSSFGRKGKCSGDRRIRVQRNPARRTGLA